MLSWMADIIQIAAGSNGFWMTVALILLSVIVHQWYKGIKSIQTDFIKISEALIKNGKPISISGELTDLEASIKKETNNLEERLANAVDLEKTLLENLKKEAEAQELFRDEPWRFCIKFTDCPAVQGKHVLALHIEEIIKEHLASETKARIEIQKGIDAAFIRAAEDRKRLEDMILENRKIITEFTTNFGSEVARAFIVSLKTRGSKEDGGK